MSPQKGPTRGPTGPSTPLAGSQKDLQSDRNSGVDSEGNRLDKRVRRYANIGTGAGAMAARLAGQYLLGRAPDQAKYAGEIAAALGALKGPIMKVAQLLSTIPGALPEDFTLALGQLQSQAPPMGWPFVKRRMARELGPDWQDKFTHFEPQSKASASLGQVHKARSHSDELLACKLQYPDMESAVEADLYQLKILFSIYKRMSPAIDPTEIAKEIGARLREELNYDLEARYMRLYGLIFADRGMIRIPQFQPSLSTRRLLTMNWLEGRPLLAYKGRALSERNKIATAMFHAWWYPFSHYGIIHGDPHLGNYTVFEDQEGRALGINLLDFGCMRVFHSRFVEGVVNLYRGLLRGDRDMMVHAYESWGFSGLSNELIDILNIWANLVYGPLLEDREHHLAEGVSPTQYGRREAFEVHKGLREKGPIKVPREFVFMDRAAIGLGGVFLHLNARLNFFQIFNEMIENFETSRIDDAQKKLFTEVNIALPGTPEF